MNVHLANSVASISAYDALRFIAYEASECRGKDAHEALCLLPPALLRACSLKPMDGREAAAFRAQLKKTLAGSGSTHPESRSTFHQARPLNFL